MIDYFIGKTHATGEIELPPGNYTYLCTTTDITEDIAAGIVDETQIRFSEVHTMYIHYVILGAVCTRAATSFESLLQKHSLTGRYAILVTDKK